MHQSPVAEVSRDAQSLPVRQREIVDILVGAQRNGRADLTRKEIQQRLEQRLGYRISDGTVCSAVSRLVEAGLLEVTPERRRCEVTHKVAWGVYIPQQQSRLA